MQAVKTVFDVLQEKAEDIGYGEWEIKLIIYNGKITGFDQIVSPTIKFRVSVGKKSD